MTPNGVFALFQISRSENWGRSPIEEAFFAPIVEGDPECGGYFGIEQTVKKVTTHDRSRIQFASKRTRGAFWFRGRWQKY